MNDYTQKVFTLQENNPTDELPLKAMIKMTKKINKSLNSNPSKINDQMVNFGGSGGKMRNGQAITVNAAGLTRRQFGGHGPAPQGRKPEEQSGKTQEFIGPDGQPTTAKSMGPPKKKAWKRPHDFTAFVDKNLAWRGSNRGMDN